MRSRSGNGVLLRAASSQGAARAAISRAGIPQRDMAIGRHAEGYSTGYAAVGLPALGSAQGSGKPEGQARTAAYADVQAVVVQECGFLFARDAQLDACPHPVRRGRFQSVALCGARRARHDNACGSFAGCALGQKGAADL